MIHSDINKKKDIGNKTLVSFSSLLQVILIGAKTGRRRRILITISALLIEILLKFTIWHLRKQINTTIHLSLFLYHLSFIFTLFYNSYFFASKRISYILLCANQYFHNMICFNLFYCLFLNTNT